MNTPFRETERDVNGMTYREWADDLFLFDDCDLCRKGTTGHTAVLILGHWFAACKEQSQ